MQGGANHALRYVTRGAEWVTKIVSVSFLHKEQRQRLATQTLKAFATETVHNGGSRWALGTQRENALEATKGHERLQMGPGRWRRDQLLGNVETPAL
jgi:hypothetical protein